MNTFKLHVLFHDDEVGIIKIKATDKMNAEKKAKKRFFVQHVTHYEIVRP